MDFALLLNDGKVTRLSLEAAAAYHKPGFLWVHLEGLDENDTRYLRHQQDIPGVATSALTAFETRPRCEQIETGAILNLRGPGDIEPGDSDPLVSIRLWVHEAKVTSLSRRTMQATGDVVKKMEAGRILDAGDLVAAFAHMISVELDPEVAKLGDDLDEIESALESGNLFRHRTLITRIRSAAINYRRFVAPDRDALNTLAGLDFEWLAEDDRMHIREAADRFARMAEELEAVRERAALLHEQITDLRAEQIDQRSLYIAVVAFIFLPLTFVTGLLGMNVGGLPFQGPGGFWEVTALCVLLAIAIALWFAWRHWLPRDRESD
jgi:zinc transporter